MYLTRVIRRVFVGDVHAAACIPRPFYEVIIGLFLSFRASASLDRDRFGDPAAVHTCLSRQRTVAEFLALVSLVLAFPVHRRRILLPSDYRSIVVQL